MGTVRTVFSETSSGYNEKCPQASGKDDNSPFHTQGIVERADVGVNAGRGKGDAKPSLTQRSLRQKEPLLRGRNDEA